MKKLPVSLTIPLDILTWPLSIRSSYVRAVQGFAQGTVPHSIKDFFQHLGQLLSLV